MLAPPGVRQERAALGHAVADGDREADPEEELLDHGVQGRPSDDDLEDPPAEGVDQLLPEKRVDPPPQRRHPRQELHDRLLEEGADPLRVDLLEDERDRQDEARLLGAERLEDDLRGRGLVEKGDPAADRDREEELERAAEGVGEREERHEGVARLERHVLLGEKDVPVKAPVREHDPLGEARRSRGVDDGGEVFGVRAGPGDRLGTGDRKGAGDLVGLPEGRRHPLALHEEGREVLRRQDRLHPRHLPGIEALQERLGRQEKSRLGVVQDVVDVLLPEVGEDRHRDRPVREDREVGRRPAGGIPAEEPDFRPRLHVQLAERRVDPGDAPGDLAVGLRRAREVGKGGKVGVPAEGSLEERNQRFGFHRDRQSYAAPGTR